MIFLVVSEKFLAVFEYIVVPGPFYSRHCEFSKYFVCFVLNDNLVSCVHKHIHSVHLSPGTEWTQVNALWMLSVSQLTTCNLVTSEYRISSSIKRVSYSVPFHIWLHRDESEKVCAQNCSMALLTVLANIRCTHICTRCVFAFHVVDHWPLLVTYTY